MADDTNEHPDLVLAMPVLQVSDVRVSEAFYCDRLGFRSHGTWGDGPDFAIVQRGRVTIALDRTRDGGPVPNNQYWAAYVYVTDADALHAAFRAAGVEIVRGPEDAPYGLRDFDIRDPDGHLIAFGHDLLLNDGEAGLAADS
jgi:catechol 2,3-dioxygenase-like lactoylglutathione lyase family enzyme